MPKLGALTGRRAYKVDSVLDRAEARARRRVLRQLFLSGEPELMRNAMDTAGAAWLVIDPSLREIYWEFDEESLEASGHFEKVHQIGDRYSVYRLTPEPIESRRRDPNRTPSCAKLGLFRRTNLALNAFLFHARLSETHDTAP